MNKKKIDNLFYIDSIEGFHLSMKSYDVKKDMLVTDNPLIAIDPITKGHFVDISRFLSQEQGNEIGKNILFPQRSIESYALDYKLDIVESRKALSDAKDLIEKARTVRNKPALDDKTLVSWNALMIDGLCEAYRSFGEEKHLERAKEVAGFILENMKTEDGSLFRNYKGTTASINAFLD